MRVCVITLLASAGVLLAQTAAPPQTAPPPLLAAPIGPDTVIATVDGTNVTVADFQRMSQGAPPQLTQAIKSGGAAEVLRQLFVFKYLADEGDKAKLGEQSPLKEELETQRRWVIANTEVNHVRDLYPVSQEMVQDFYTKNEPRWQQAKIKVIFVAFQPGTQSVKPDDLAALTKQYLQQQHGASALRPESEAATLAGDIVKQLRGGADFAALVQKYSEDPTSKAAAGDFGTMTFSSKYPDDFKKAVLALQSGQISEPLRQPNGYYIVKCVDKSVQSVDAVKEQITQDIRSAHLADVLKGLDQRFNPTNVNSEFFAHPEEYTKPAPAPAAAAAH